jgi:hypothetical protein
MLAISTNHNQFSPRLRNRLKTAIMGLGLVRLLLDVGRTEEARTTLCSLENAFPGVEEAETPGQKYQKTNRLQGISVRCTFPAMTAWLESVR